MPYGLTFHATPKKLVPTTTRTSVIHGRDRANRARPPYRSSFLPRRLLAVALTYPSIEARIEILRQQAAARGVLLNDRALRNLARKHAEPRALHAKVSRMAAEAALGR